MKQRIALVISFLLLVGCAQQVAVNQVKPAIVSIGGQAVTVQLARTPQEQSTGLAGTSALEWDQGMLFVFKNPSIETFWMKDMVMPIDIIWIHNSVVVGFEKSAPIQPPNISDTALPQYSSGVSVDYVLEVRAGFVDKYGVKQGDAVNIDI